MKARELKLVPSILTDSLSELSVMLSDLNVRYPRAILTIVDGIFADNLSVAIDDLEGMGIGPDLEIHLATEYPAEFLGSVMSVGVKKVWAQVERMGSVGEYIEICEELSLSPRLALDKYTPVASVVGVLEKIDGVMIFGNRAGEAPTNFDKQVFEKIIELRDLGFSGEIGVGVLDDESIMVECLEAGADIVVVGHKIGVSK